jgi:hypothetical protein
MICCTVVRQLAPLLVYLSELTVASYLDSACELGGLFIFLTEFLRVRKSIRLSVCIDEGITNDVSTPYSGLLDAYFTESSADNSSELVRMRFQGTLEQYQAQHPLDSSQQAFGT